MQNNVSKLRIITALNFVVACLALGLIWLVPIEQHIEPAGGEIYKRARAAQISLSPNVGWELELLGSGTEGVVFSFRQQNILYVFGNTTSNDLDFDKSGIFLAMIDIFGRVSDDSFFNFGGEGDILRDASLCPSGFLLAVQGAASPYLLVVGFDGSVKKRVDGFVNSFEAVDRLIAHHDGFLLLTRPFNSSQNTYGLRCVFFDFLLDFRLSSLSQSAYSLASVEVVLPSNSVVVFCNAVNAFGAEYPAVVEFFLTASARVVVLESLEGKIAGFSVHNGEYLLLTAHQGASFVRLNAALDVTLTQQLSASLPLFFTQLDDDFYAAFFSTALYIFDKNLVRTQTLSGGTPKAHLFAADSAIFCLQSDAAISLLVLSEGELTCHIPITNGTSPTISLADDTLFLTYVNADNNVVICTIRA